MVQVAAIAVIHGRVAPALAYRFDTAEGSVVFSGDTTVNDSLIALAQGADILVHQVADLGYLERHGTTGAPSNGWPPFHTDITEVGALPNPPGSTNPSLTITSWSTWTRYSMPGIGQSAPGGTSAGQRSPAVTASAGCFPRARERAQAVGRAVTEQSLRKYLSTSRSLNKYSPTRTGGRHHEDRNHGDVDGVGRGVRASELSRFRVAQWLHQPRTMACEAPAAVGCEQPRQLPVVRRTGRIRRRSVAPADFDWQESLGAYQKLPEWIGYSTSIAEFGWATVVEIGAAVDVIPGHRPIPRSHPHAHAVRAIDAADTEPRQAELARALGYWAARFEVGQPVSDAVIVEEEIRLAVVDAAAEGARHYLSRPNILNLHGVTGAMAVELLVDHIPSDAAQPGWPRCGRARSPLRQGPVGQCSGDGGRRA